MRTIFEEDDEFEVGADDNVDLSDLDDGTIDDDNDELDDLSGDDSNTDDSEPEDDSEDNDEDEDEVAVIPADDDDITLEADEEMMIEDCINDLIEEFERTIPDFYDESTDEVVNEAAGKDWQWRTLPNGVHVAFDKKGNCVAGPKSVVALFNTKKKKAAKKASNKKYWDKNKDIINAKRRAKKAPKRTMMPLAASLPINYEMIRDDKGRTINYMGESIYLADDDANRKEKLIKFIDECNCKICEKCKKDNKKAAHKDKNAKLVSELMTKYVSDQAPDLAKAVNKFVSESSDVQILKDGTSYNIILDRDAVHDINELSGSLLYYNNSPKKGVLKTSLSNGTNISLYEGTRNRSTRNSEISIRVSL